MVGSVEDEFTDFVKLYEPRLRIALMSAAVTTTVAPSTTVTTTVPESDIEPLVLVAFGDSVISYPEPSEAAIGAYAAILEEEFERPVLMRNRAVWASTPTQLLNALATEPVQAGLAKADVVLLEIPLGDTDPAFPTAVGLLGRDPADCGGDDHQQACATTSLRTRSASKRSTPLLRRSVIPRTR